MSHHDEGYKACSPLLCRTWACGKLIALTHLWSCQTWMEYGVLPMLARPRPVMPGMDYSVPIALANGWGAVSWPTPPWVRAFVCSLHGRVFLQLW